MRFIPTLLHGIADYIVGLVVIALPFVFGWGGPGRWALVGLGVFVIAYSLCTDYELGVARILSVRSHLVLDYVFAVSMLFLPWLFDLPRSIMVIGVLGIVLAATTKPGPQSA